MPQNENLRELIYKAYHTLLKIMKFQNYTISKYENFNIHNISQMITTNNLNMFFDEFNEENHYYNYLPDFLKIPFDDQYKPKTLIHFHIDKILRKNVLYDLVEEFYHIEEKITKNDVLLIVTKESQNESMLKEIQQLWEQDHIFIVVFSIYQLQFFTLEHTLVPIHIPLSQKQKQLVYEKHNINNDSELPGISQFDPCALCISLRPKQLCYIARPSSTTVIQPFYRICQ